MALVREVDPGAVLVEGPSHYDQLLSALSDPATRPPVAVLSVRHDAGGNPTSTFFPLADFSPEWVALREAAARGIPAAFIDRPWADDNDDGDDTGALRSERYYAQSQALAALARAEHCRDHDELWEHLFELRGPETPWRELFDDVFAWSAMARLDYEPQVLASEGSLPREAVMVHHVRRWREQVDGPLVVVTGAFHTLALVEALATHLLGVTVPGADDLGEAVTESHDQPAWLIRYDLTRLNALTGYGAGIRAPGFYQHQWDATTTEPVALGCLADIARTANDAGTSDRLSVASLIEAGLHAQRLADLRGHPYPGRADLLDACTSCFADGSMPPAVRDAIGQVFGGSRLGEVPAGTAAPPIVDEARTTARRLRLVVTDSARHTTTLDVRRSASARARSRFLWLMSYLGTGFAERVAGPDYVAGRGLHRIREQWTYAWTPMVEAELVALVSHGTTLAEAAQHRLHKQEPSADERSSAAVAATIAQAALLGLADEVVRLTTRLDHMVEQDPGLASVLGTTSRLLGLWRSRELLDLAEPQRLLALVARALPQLAYLLDGSATVAAEDEPEVVGAVVGTYDLLRQLGDDDLSAQVVHDAFARLRERSDISPGVRGAVLALGCVSGDITDEALAKAVQTVFGPGADPGYAVRFLDGFMQAAPDLFLHVPELFDAVDTVVATLDSDAFLSFLPELRRSFTRLRPFETAKVAERVAARTGADVTAVAATVAATSGDLEAGTAVERALLASLSDDGLTNWAVL